MPGTHFEDFEVGAVIERELRRTVTESDNVWASDLTTGPQPLHLNATRAPQR